VQSILASSTYSYFLENFSFKSRCNRCSNGLFGWILGKIETKSNGLGLSQAHANLLEQMRVNLWHGFWLVTHPKNVDVLLAPLTKQPRFAETTESVPTHTRLV